MPSKPVLRMEEKQRIKQQLLRLCEEAWIDQGYKKTSIKYLCTEAGISIGTCYALFSTKEKIFLATAQRIQSRLMERFKETVSQQPNQKGVSTALKELAREFDRAPFLYDVSTPDFRAFVTKLSVEEMRSIKFESITFFRNVCQMANLEPVIDNETAFGVLSTLLSTISTKKTLEPVCDFFTVFDFMTDRLIAELFADKVSERSSLRET